MSKDPFEKMFGEFRRDLEKYTEETQKIFEKTAKYGARKFVNIAKDLTDAEPRVDTGNYKRNWHAEVDALGTENIVWCENSAEYASFLEEGYTIKKDYFVPFNKMDGSPKTKAFIASYKAKYPNAKGFIRKAGRVKGSFIGRRAMDEAQWQCIKKLQRALDKIMKKKK